MTTPIKTEQRTAPADGQELVAKHLTAIPKFIYIAEQAANEVYQSMSHDRLDSLRLAEIGELLDGPESMLKVVWIARWCDGHTDTFQFIVPGRFAEEIIDKLPVRMAHRLMREVFRKDTILAL